MNTTYWRNTIMTAIYGGSSGRSYYVGLSSTTPTASGTNVTEPTGNNYSRVQITSFTTPNNGSVSNSAALVFPTSSGVWFPGNTPATHWVLYDGNSSGAHLLSAGTLESAIGIYKNTTVTIPAGEVVITLTDNV